MPELPEVETTLRGISPWVVGETIQDLEIRNRSLRWPIPDIIGSSLVGQTIDSARRRGKYLLLQLSGGGTLIIHLGMSGSLRVVTKDDSDWRKHDHVGLTVSSGKELRFHDPRRFGCWLYSAPGEAPEECHALLNELGPEPLGDDFNEAYLWKKCRDRKVAIKQLIMNSKVVVGVGNIYACEALFLAGISPRKAAGRVTRKKIGLLVDAIREVLGDAIEMGGTTLRDFLNAEGEAGYFKQELRVYDRENEICRTCDAEIKRIVQSNRSTFYCSACQN
ncbi:MAG: bifunctional DNA-formamidopyrimidine glycosylase/DNA-(apurinic or apyrimidinic site) lyase [Verrucomicrobiota bacterium]